MTELNTYLLAHTALAALVGTKIYPVQAPSDAVAPYLVYFQVSAPRGYTHQGYGNWQTPRIQISCYAARYITNGTEIGARSIAETLKTALEAWQGAAKIQAVQIEGDQDLIDPGTNLYHVAVDVFVTYGA